MNKLTEAIETIQDMLDVAERTGSAYVYTHNGGNERIRNVLDQLQAYKELQALKSSDVAPVVHGRWILVNAAYGEYERSVCNAGDSDCSDYYSAHNVTSQDWCPNCGAKMDLEK